MKLLIIISAESNFGILMEEWSWSIWKRIFLWYSDAFDAASPCRQWIPVMNFRVLETALSAAAMAARFLLSACKQDC